MARHWKRITRMDALVSLAIAAANGGTWVWANQKVLEKPIPWYFGAPLFIGSLLLLLLLLWWKSDGANGVVPKVQEKSSREELDALHKELAHWRDAANVRDALHTKCLEEVKRLEYEAAETRERGDQEQKRRLDVLKNAPRLLIEHGRFSAQDILIFTNDGPSRTLANVELILKQQRLVQLHHRIPSLPAKQQHQCPAEIGGSSMSYILTTSTTEDSIVANYEDSDGRKFSREFLVRTFARGRVNFEPGPIRLRE